MIRTFTKTDDLCAVPNFEKPKNVLTERRSTETDGITNNNVNNK